MNVRLSVVLLLAASTLVGQKKVLDHPDFDIWNTIESPVLSADGNYLMYSLERGEGDQFLKLKSRDGNLLLEYPRAGRGTFSYDSRHAVFAIRAWKDSVKEMKRRRVKKKDLPMDSLGIFDLGAGKLTRIPRIKSYALPEKWGGYLAYQFDSAPVDKEQKKDSANGKKPGKENGYHLVLRELRSGKEDTLRYVTAYTFAKKGKKLAYTSTGNSSDDPSGLYVIDLEKGETVAVHEGKKAKYYQANFSDSGSVLGFVADLDTTRVRERPTRLYYWKDRMKKGRLALGAETGIDGLRASVHDPIGFSEDEGRMYFGLARPRVYQDTSLLDEEIARVEVWTYDEPRLYTVQEMQLKNDTVAAYRCVLNLSSGKIVRLATEEYPEAEITGDGNGSHALLKNETPYLLESQWLGWRAADYALVDLSDGSRKKILSQVAGRVRLSPKGQYAYGYSTTDSLWFAYNIRKDSYVPLTRGSVFYNELHDTPSPPSSYGAAGWTEKDGALILYDRYDLWMFDPDSGISRRLTRGRESRTVYRYVKEDPDERSLDPNRPWLLTTFDESSKSSGYARLEPSSGRVSQIMEGAYRFGRPVKARGAEVYMFTRESFREFPNLHISEDGLRTSAQVSDANPQQADYRWGTIELVEWTSLDGRPLRGMLVKPEDFDPSRKYPMIVNFYEKSSDRLHSHRAPSPGRSTINYSFYASRGYLIFNPDVYYRTGYPGESAYNCVIPGITSLIDKGFVDKDRIGVQGHSWGGYQIAYLVTKTNMFRAAEAGAPVPNMISAYGGIRWWTGLSRQFQYEHTQSRIGGTPWEYPMRYVENSPIFNIDKIQTPLLIMHNDEDGHVPWYQGIEFFVSLRRLGKPSWFLNYNGEPHWPLKRQNRKDFNIRLAQFFDHYLMDQPLPVWMKRGVPAKEKGIRQGYELLEQESGK